MTQPSKEAIRRANALIRAVTPENVLSSAEVRPDRDYRDDAFCRFIQEVSDVAKLNDMIVERFAKEMVLGQNWKDRAARVREANKTLILPDPEPDVLAEVLESGWKNDRIDAVTAYSDDAEVIRTELAKRGYEIRKVSE